MHLTIWVCFAFVYFWTSSFNCSVLDIIASKTVIGMQPPHEQLVNIFYEGKLSSTISLPFLALNESSLYFPSPFRRPQDGIFVYKGHASHSPEEQSIYSWPLATTHRGQTPYSPAITATYEAHTWVRVNKYIACTILVQYQACTNKEANDSVSCLSATCVASNIHQ